MTNEELNKINKIMTKIFWISAVIYGLFVFCVYYFCKNILTPTQLLLIIIFAPMVVGGIILLVYKLKHPPVIDESEDAPCDSTANED